MDLQVEWLGRIEYRRAWSLQHELVAARAVDQVADTLLLLEHPAVLTLGRHADPRHILVSSEELQRRCIDVIQVERGGEVTYHGPGQLVAYPILKLASRGLLLRPLVRALEETMDDVAASYGVLAGRCNGNPGSWADPSGPSPRKLGSLGLRIERGVSYHGIGLNITTDLADFAVINPCGFAGLDVTSIAREAGWIGAAARPSTESVEEAARRFAAALEGRLREAADVSERIAGAPGGISEFELPLPGGADADGVTTMP